VSRYEDLAAEYGTPLYVYDLDEVLAAREQLFDQLPEPFELFYALKANPHPDLLAALRSGDGRKCRAEISSTGELANALAAGFAGGDCMYTGPGKTFGELRDAMSLGVRMFSTDSVTDVQHVGQVATELGITAEALLRVNLATASAGSGIRMTGTPSQFGFDAELLHEVLPELRRVDGVTIAGMHLFPLSNTADEDALIAEFQNTIAGAAVLSETLDLPLRYLDIGGGFSVPYGIPGLRASYPKLRQELEVALDVHFPAWREGSPQLACESGRYLIGASGTLLAGVSNVKVSRGSKFVILDAGINTFGGMSGLGRLLPVQVGADAEPTQTVSLVGPLCTPGDTFGRAVKVPDLHPGDVIRIPNVGAYGPTASLLMFLGRPSPTEIVVRGDEIVSVSRLEHSRSYDSQAVAR
jgi:diaminopimelate decarboxylase